MKIIFLDFDGVLCNRESISLGYKQRQHAEDDPYAAHPDCVAALNRIIEATGAQIVVSSTWRRGSSIADTRGRLKRWGVNGTVIDITPTLNGDEYAYKRRGCEIQQWLNTHSQHSIESFVILDDDSDMNGLKHRLVQSRSEIGLTDDDANRAIAMLHPLTEGSHSGGK